jgi:hypothetical protein
MKITRSCAANSRSLKKPHSRLQDCRYLIQAGPR